MRCIQCAREVAEPHACSAACLLSLCSCSSLTHRSSSPSCLPHLTHDVSAFLPCGVHGAYMSFACRVHVDQSMLVSLIPLHDLNHRLLKASNDGCMRAGGTRGRERASVRARERARESYFCQLSLPPTHTDTHTRTHIGTKHTHT